MKRRSDPDDDLAALFEARCTVKRTRYEPKPLGPFGILLDESAASFTRSELERIIVARETHLFDQYKTLQATLDRITADNKRLILLLRRPCKWGLTPL
jgi:hypothetical protein